MNFPLFNNEVGPSYTPTAIFINDAPKALYSNTIINQFADDIIHIVTSDQTGPHKISNAREKLTHELKSIQVWERKWKIKTNTNKIKIGYFGTTPEKMDIHNNIVINKITLPFESSIRILGYTISTHNRSRLHINNRVPIASNHLSKLHRFKHATSETKLYLYKALILPLLEYPSIPMSVSHVTYISKLQRVQNKALRFIYNYKLSDRVSSEFMHTRAKLDPINVRLSKLARKAFYSMRDSFFPSEEETPDPPYLKLVHYTDYINNNEPIRPPMNSHAKHVNQTIFQPYLGFNINILNIPDEWENWTIPDPKYL